MTSKPTPRMNWPTGTPGNPAPPPPVVAHQLPPHPVGIDWLKFAPLALTIVLTVGGGLLALGRYESRTEARFEAIIQRLEATQTALNQRMTAEVTSLERGRADLERRTELSVVELQRRQASDDRINLDTIQKLSNLDARVGSIYDVVSDLRSMVRGQSRQP